VPPEKNKEIQGFIQACLFASILEMAKLAAVFAGEAAIFSVISCG
jgi:hypothetical protein